MWQGLLPIENLSSPQDPPHGGISSQVSRVRPQLQPAFEPQDPPLDPHRPQATTPGADGRLPRGDLNQPSGDTSDPAGLVPEDTISDRLRRRYHFVAPQPSAAAAATQEESSGLFDRGHHEEIDCVHPTLCNVHPLHFCIQCCP